MVPFTFMMRIISVVFHFFWRLTTCVGACPCRSLTVADILAADFILAPLQLFSAEGLLLKAFFQNTIGLCEAGNVRFSSLYISWLGIMNQTSTILHLLGGYQRHFDALAKPGLDLWCSPADDDVTPPVEAPRENPPAEPLRCGEMVQLHGLERVELNGCKGRLLEWQGATGRWSCLLTEKKKRKDSKKLLVNVKPCNVKALKQRGAQGGRSWKLENDRSLFYSITHNNDNEY